MSDLGNHQKNLSNKMLLLINAGIFISVGSVSSRFHVLQVWLNLNYAEFSWLLLSFSCGQILSNLIIGRLIPLFGSKKILLTMMAFISFALINFIETPSYTVVLVLFLLLSFGFGGGMVVVMAQAGTVQTHQGKFWISFFQGVSGVGVIGGMASGLLTNYLNIPIDIHFPFVGIMLLILLTITIHGYVPYEIDRSQEDKIYELSTKIILLGCINFILILSTSSSIISWSGVTLRDKFLLPDDLATLGAFGFVFSETAIRFYGDRLTKRFGKIPLLIGTGLFTCLSLLLVYLIHHPIWALLSFACVGLASGTIQPIVFSLTAEQKGNVSYNMSFIMLFQSVAFLSGPMITGLIAQHIGLFEIYLFCSCTSILIVLFAILFRKEQKKLYIESIS